ncbi:MAG TPA: hypothetical protein VGM03_23450, partial [Phycisphaerae bacterium]
MKPVRSSNSPKAGDTAASLLAPARAAGTSWRWGVGIALLAAVCYVDTLINDFTYDDEPVVVHSERIRSLS